MTRLEHDWLPVDLPANIDLAEHTYVHSAFAFLHYRSERPCGLRLGRHTAVYDAAMFDLGPCGEVDIGEYGIINSSHFIANSRIAIGDFAYISYEVYISDAFAPVPPVDTAYDVEPRPGVESIVIGDDCWVGMRSAILRGSRLGRGVIVGAGSVVSGPVPDYTIVAGSPARPVGKVTPGEGTRGTQRDWWAQ